MLDFLKASDKEMEDRNLAQNVVQALTQSKDILPCEQGAFNVKTGLVFKAVLEKVHIESIGKGNVFGEVSFNKPDCFIKLLNAYDVPGAIIDKVLANRAEE
ncbi:hypothetical protein [Agaribacter marinus]|uniref:Uncharacterized protein n=1 Tax=Agaribacter marinus TaxID=1431249 RepID=A0AA37SXH0_9ALTE|nr:hypothetical protein [Agaribacter marinus]GLR71638.1 hypothetical protein GCM10007852_25460 [Agaribacter marinus]